MAVVVDQTIPSEIEESYKKCLTKAHTIHSGKDIVTKVPPFRQPTWIGFRPNLPTSLQRQVRIAFKKSCNCFNNLAWEKKAEAWQYNEDEAYDCNYFRWWMHEAIGLFYHDVRHPWCTPEMCGDVIWEHAYHKAGGACADTNFDDAFKHAGIMFDYEDWVELDDPYDAKYTGFWANCHYDSATGKWWIFFEGVWGAGELEFDWTLAGHYASVRLEITPDEDIEKYKGLLWFTPKPTALQKLANLTHPFQAEGAAWRTGVVGIGEMAGQQLCGWLKFDLHAGYYIPEKIKFKPPEINGDHWIGGVGTTIELVKTKK